MSEPAEVFAGDSWAWSVDLADYPAPTWELHYILRLGASSLQLDAVASGATHVIGAAPATTAPLASGNWEFQAYVISGATRKTIKTGVIAVRASLVTATATPLSVMRSVESKLVAALQSDRIPVEEYEIEGRRMKFRSLGDIIRALQWVRSEINRLERTARIAQGLDGGNRLYVEFR